MDGLSATTLIITVLRLLYQASDSIRRPAFDDIRDEVEGLNAVSALAKRAVSKNQGMLNAS